MSRTPDVLSGFVEKVKLRFRVVSKRHKRVETVLEAARQRVPRTCAAIAETYAASFACCPEQAAEILELASEAVLYHVEAAAVDIASSATKRHEQGRAMGTRRRAERDEWPKWQAFIDAKLASNPDLSWPVVVACAARKFAKVTNRSIRRRCQDRRRCQEPGSK